MLPDETKPVSQRKQFLQRSISGVAALGATTMAAPMVHAAGSDVIKFGLIGCGGRGSGAAGNAMNAGRDIRLVAMADILEDRLSGSRERLQKAYPEQATVDDAHCFLGFDAYEKLIDCGVDVVLIATTSHFLPMIATAAAKAGKHVFCEKPHGLDVPGVKISQAAAEEAKKQGRCFVSGLCWRYDLGVREAMKRIQDGAIGDVIAIQETYVCGPYNARARQPEWNEMRYQLENWYHFNWLSGDQTAQQLIHSLDKASWVMGDVPPKKAWGMGGRQVCLEPLYGDQFDHYAVVFEYENGVRVFAYTRDIPGCFSETSDVVLGTKGQAVMPAKPRIDGENPWRYSGPTTSMTDNEQKALFDAVRSGTLINNGDYACTSSLLAIMAQMTSYTGQEVTWEQVLNSQLSFAQPRYGWDAEPPVKPGPDGRYATAMPGITPLT